MDMNKKTKILAVIMLSAVIFSAVSAAFANVAAAQPPHPVSVVVDGVPVVFDQEPVIINDRVIAQLPELWDGTLSIFPTAMLL